MSSESKKSGSSKNRISFKEQSDGTYRYTGSFSYKSLACRVDGTWDPTTKAAGPVTFVLKEKAKNVLKIVMADHARGVAAHIDFGRSTNGTEELNLVVERFDNISLISGDADGRSLLPIRLEGCACSETDLGRPVLATVRDDRINAVSVMPGTPLPPSELDGLAASMQSGLNSFGRGPGTIIDDIIDGGRFVACMFFCYIEFLLCLGKASKTPGSGTLAQICYAILIMCRGNCRIDILI